MGTEKTTGEALVQKRLLAQNGLNVQNEEVELIAMYSMLVQTAMVANVFLEAVFVRQSGNENATQTAGIDVNEVTKRKTGIAARGIGTVTGKGDETVSANLRIENVTGSEKKRVIVIGVMIGKGNESNGETRRRLGRRKGSQTLQQITDRRGLILGDIAAARTAVLMRCLVNEEGPRRTRFVHCSHQV